MYHAMDDGLMSFKILSTLAWGWVVLEHSLFQKMSGSRQSASGVERTRFKFEMACFSTFAENL